MSTIKAFTIIELILIVTIVGVMSLITMASYSSITSKAIDSSLKSDLINSSKKLKLFQASSADGTYPTSNNCTNTLPSQICLQSSGSNAYVYTPSSGNKSYTLTATRNTTTYRITDTTSPVLVAEIQVILSSTFSSSLWGSTVNGDAYDCWGGSYSTDASFNLSPYVNGIFSAASISWSRANFYSQNSLSINKYLLSGDGLITLATWSFDIDATSYSGPNLLAYINSKKGATAGFNWTSDDGYCPDVLNGTFDIYGYQSGLSNPTLTLTWTPN